METEVQGYLIAWIAYLFAAAGCCVIAWRVLHRWLARDLAILLEALLVALLFTPWYVLPEQETMAPAFIVFLMDVITIDLEAGVRAFVPLIMSMLLALLVAIVLSIVLRVAGRRGRKREQGS